MYHRFNWLIKTKSVTVILQFHSWHWQSIILVICCHLLWLLWFVNCLELATELIEIWQYVSELLLALSCHRNSFVKSVTLFSWSWNEIICRFLTMNSLSKLAQLWFIANLIYLPLRVYWVKLIRYTWCHCREEVIKLVPHSSSWVSLGAFIISKINCL